MASRNASQRTNDDFQTSNKRRRINLAYPRVKIGERLVNGIDMPLLERKCKPFYDILDNMKDTGGVCEIRDIEENLFLSLYRLAVSDSLTFDLHESVISKIYQAAKRFRVQKVIDFCLQETKRHITKKNVCWFMEFGHNNDLRDLKRRCLTFIRQNLSAILRANLLVNLCLICLKDVLGPEQDRPASVLEIDVFTALLNWSRHQNGYNHIREYFTLVTELIRFPRIKTGQFFTIVRESNVLPGHLFRYYAMYFLERHQTLCLNNFQAQYPGQPYQLPQPSEPQLFDINRFHGIVSGKYYRRNNHDAISFIVDANLKFHGIMIFGSHQRPAVYNIQMEILKEGEDVFHQNYRTQTDGNTRMYKLSLNPPVAIERDKCYTIDLLMNGITSYYGIGGNPHISCNGISITFIPNDNSRNLTNVQMGQIPALIFEKSN